LTGAEAQPPRMGPDGPGRHGGMDADHNGSISRAEFNAAGDELFSRLDANHDGRVTRAEAEAARPFGPPPGGPPPEGAQPPR
jgi:hypothetical protein